MASLFYSRGRIGDRFFVLYGPHHKAMPSKLSLFSFRLSCFQCQCCQTDVGTIQDTLPDVSIAYKLHLECGRMINLYDWLQVRTFCRFVTCKVVFQNQAKCLCSYWLMTREFVYRNSGVFRCTKSGHCKRIVEGLSKEEENDDLRWRNTVSFGWWPLFVHHGLFPSPYLVVAACIKATRVGLKCVYVQDQLTFRALIQQISGTCVCSPPFSTSGVNWEERLQVYCLQLQSAHVKLRLVKIEFHKIRQVGVKTFWNSNLCELVKARVRLVNYTCSFFIELTPG